MKLMMNDKDVTVGEGYVTSQVEYSLEEQRIGIWYNGKALYQRTFVVTVVGEETLLPEFEFDELVNGFGNGISNNYKCTIPNANSSIYVKDIYAAVWLSKANINSDLVITLQYTKDE